MAATAPTRTSTISAAPWSDPSASSTGTAGDSGKRSYLPDPKPPRRKRDRKLMDRLRQVPCQITGRLPATSHHLTPGASRSDEESGLFRVVSEIHDLFHNGSERQRSEAATAIREHMTDAQIRYVIDRKGVDWLDARYPSKPPSGEDAPANKEKGS